MIVIGCPDVQLGQIRLIQGLCYDHGFLWHYGNRLVIRPKINDLIPLSVNFGELLPQ